MKNRLNSEDKNTDYNQIKIKLLLITYLSSIDLIKIKKPIIEYYTLLLGLVIYR